MLREPKSRARFVSIAAAVVLTLSLGPTAGGADPGPAAPEAMGSLTPMTQNWSAALLQSTYLGGTGFDDRPAVAVGPTGDVYVTGETNSGDYPTSLGAFDRSYGGGYDAFVTRFNGSTGGFVYTTFLGGSGADRGVAIAVDSQGAAYIVGETTSGDLPFSGGAFSTAFNGTPNSTTTDLFVAKLAPSGGALSYCTYLGGNASEWAGSIAVDGNGSAFVAGSTFSAAFPQPPGGFGTFPGGNAVAFVAKLAPDGGSLDYVAGLGGDGTVLGRTIALAAGGEAMVAGQTQARDFPVTPGAFNTSYLDVFNNYGDGFVTRVNASGSGLVFSTLLGGASADDITGIALSPGGEAVIAGFTLSQDFPTTAGALATGYVGGTADAFVTKLSADGSALGYSTYLGSFLEDRAAAVAVDSFGVAFVAGRTSWSNFPTTPGAFDETFNGPAGGGRDAFVVGLSPNGSALDYGTFFGGGGDDAASGLALGADGAIVLVGDTNSSDLPTDPSAWQQVLRGSSDAFFTRLALPPGDFSVEVSSSTLTAFPGTSVATNVTVGRIGGYAGPVVSVSLGAPAPAGVNGTCSPPGVQPAGTCQFWVDVGASVPLGSYNLTLMADNASTNHSVPFLLQVVAPPPPPDFAVSLSTGSITIAAGASGDVAVTIERIAGYAGPPSDVTIDAGGADITGTCAPPQVAPPGQCTLSVAVGVGVAPGDYPVIVGASNGTANRNATLVVTVQTPPPPPPPPGDFEVRLNVSAVNVTAGGAAEVTVFVDQSGAYAGPSVGILVDAPPAGVSFSCAPFAVAPNGSCVLSVEASASAALGPFSIAVRGTNGTANRSAVLSVTVLAAPPPPDFAIALSAANLTVEAGAGGAVDVAVVGLGGYDGPGVTISLHGAPPYVVGGCGVAPRLPGDTCSLTVSASLLAAPGTYNLTVEGSNGTAVRSAALRLTVAPRPVVPPSFDFRLEVAEPDNIIAPGTEARLRVTFVPLNGTAGSAVQVAVHASEPGISGRCDPPTASIGGNCTLVIAVGAGVPAGTYPVTVTASNGSVSREGHVSVVVGATAARSADGTFFGLVLAIVAAGAVAALVALRWRAKREGPR